MPNAPRNCSELLLNEDMFEEFAIDPALVVQWEYFDKLRSQFGLDKGRLIADYPNKGWKKEVANLLLAKQSNANPVRNCSTIEAWLTGSDGTRDLRLARAKRPYDQNKKWIRNAEEQAPSFHAVVSQDLIEVQNAIQVTETMCLDEHPLFCVETQPRISRTNEALIDVAKPLLQCSSKIKWVDRFFDSQDPTKTGPFKHMLQWIGQNFANRQWEIELHVERSDAFSQNTKDNYFRALSPLVTSGVRMTVFFWKAAAENLHPRFLLTDVGGLQYDYGLDRGHVATETSIVILQTPTRWKDEWQRYSQETMDLHLVPDQHILPITP